MCKSKSVMGNNKLVKRKIKIINPLTLNQNVFNWWALVGDKCKGSLHICRPHKFSDATFQLRVVYKAPHVPCALFIMTTFAFVVTCKRSPILEKKTPRTIGYIKMADLKYYTVSIILSWCWWDLVTSANQIAQNGSCDRSRIHNHDLGGTGVWPGKK